MIDPEGLQAPRHLAKVNDARGGTWGPDGTILFAPEPGSAILRVDAAGGGEPHAVTRLDASRGEVGHLRPQWIDDERFLYLVKSDRPETEGLYVGSLDGSLKKRLLPVGTAARFAPPDLLLLLQGDRLVARRLELATLEVAPEAWAIADGVDYNTGFDLLPVSSSATGRLVFHPPSKQEVRQLLRVDRAGATLATLGEPGDLNLDLSPDGQRLATQRFDDDRRPAIWIRDLARDATSVLTREVGAEGPVWSPDGRRIAYSVSEAAESRLVVRPAAGGAPLVELRLPYLQEPVDWSPDGRWILAEVGSPGERLNLVLVATGGSGEVTRYVATAASEHSGRFSPDGRFVAYVSDETGRQQVYVEPMPRSGARWVVSPRAGAAPRWSAEGRELLYTEPVGRGDAVTLMSVAVTRAGDDLALGQATPLGPLPSPDYEPVPGGRELLVGSPVEQGEPRPPVLIEGWTALVPRR